MARGREVRERFLLDPAVVFLNHGSFGACPREVLGEQGRIRSELEREPVRFMLDRLEPELDRVRVELARRFSADAEGIAFVPNATTAVATVLDSLALAPGDELLVTDHAYAACKNVLTRAAERRGAEVVVARIPFPLEHESEVTSAVLEALGPRTKLALLDHVTSPTALVFPIADLVARVQERGVDVLVDGAHAPGMVPLELERLGAAYYAANLHKWCCAPKGAGILYARADRRERLSPLVASHGMTSPRRDRSRYLLEFDWTGTHDPSAYLSVPAALAFLDSVQPGGLSAVMQSNHELACQAIELVTSALGRPRPCPDAMLGSMASLPLDDGPHSGSSVDLERALFARGIEIPINPWPRPESRLLRLSAHAYNELGDYERLAEALAALLR